MIKISFPSLTHLHPIPHSTMAINPVGSLHNDAPSRMNQPQLGTFLPSQSYSSRSTRNSNQSAQQSNTPHFSSLRSRSQEVQRPPPPTNHAAANPHPHIYLPPNQISPSIRLPPTPDSLFSTFTPSQSPQTRASTSNTRIASIAVPFVPGLLRSQGDDFARGTSYQVASLESIQDYRDLHSFLNLEREVYPAPRSSSTLPPNLRQILYSRPPTSTFIPRNGTVLWRGSDLGPPTTSESHIRDLETNPRPFDRRHIDYRNLGLDIKASPNKTSAATRRALAPPKSQPKPKKKKTTTSVKPDIRKVESKTGLPEQEGSEVVEMSEREFKEGSPPRMAEEKMEENHFTSPSLRRQTEESETASIASTSSSTFASPEASVSTRFTEAEKSKPDSNDDSAVLIQAPQVGNGSKESVVFRLRQATSEVGHEDDGPASTTSPQGSYNLRSRNSGSEKKGMQVNSEMIVDALAAVESANSLRRSQRNSNSPSYYEEPIVEIGEEEHEKIPSGNKSSLQERRLKRLVPSSSSRVNSDDDGGNGRIRRTLPIRRAASANPHLSIDTSKSKAVLSGAHSARAGSAKPPPFTSIIPPPSDSALIVFPRIYQPDPSTFDRASMSSKPPKLKKGDPFYMTPRANEAKNEFDLYSPSWIRAGTGAGELTHGAEIGSREGWCSLCKEGDENFGGWMNLRNSSYRYHLVRQHGINFRTLAPVEPPSQTRVLSENETDGFQQLIGQCPSCQ